jgi:hypothetical protein
MISDERLSDERLNEIAEFRSGEVMPFSTDEVEDIARELLAIRVRAQPDSVGKIVNWVGDADESTATYGEVARAVIRLVVFGLTPAESVTLAEYLAETRQNPPARLYSEEEALQALMGDMSGLMKAWREGGLPSFFLRRLRGEGGEGGVKPDLGVLTCDCNGSPHRWENGCPDTDGAKP